MNLQDKKMYSQIYSVLLLLGREYIEKLPEKLFNFIKSNRLKNYNPIYNMNKPLNKQDIQKDSLAMIAIFNFKYWSESEKEKKEIFSLLEK